MENEENIPVEENKSDPNFALIDELKQQNELLVNELRELKEAFKANFNSSPDMEDIDDFDKECAKKYK